MAKPKYIQLSFSDAMSMTVMIDNQEITVRECTESAFAQLVSKAIAGHNDQAMLEKELKDMCYQHSADKWFCANILRRRGINMNELPHKS